MMKYLRWISLMLVFVMVLTCVAGCKGAEEEEFGVTDSQIGSTDSGKDPSDEKEDDPQKPTTPDKNDDPKEDQNPETPEDPEEPKDPEDPKEPDEKDEPKDPQKPDNSQPEDPQKPDDSEEDDPDEWKTMEKESSGVPITFMMQNIFHGGNDTIETSSTDQYKLGNRMARWRSMVKANDPDIIFVQESRTGQIDFFDKDPYMSQVYDFTYHYRMESKAEAGGLQAEPVLYKTSKFKKLDEGYFWLSETPTIPSVSFDSTAQTGHICNWVKLQEKSSGIVMYAYCVHIDPYGKSCPHRSMELYYEKAALAKEDEYVFFGGDFNQIYRNDYYNMMMDDWTKVFDFRDMAMYLYKDGLCELGGMGSSKNDAWKNETVPQANGDGGQIDYLMGKPMPHMTIDYYGFDYAVYNDTAAGVPDGHISDHWGLVVKMRLDTDPDYSQYQRKPYDYDDGTNYQNEYYFNVQMKS